MITLKDIGESVIDAHPMVAILGDGKTIFIAIIIMIISCITAMISSVETSYNNKKMKKVFVVSLTVTALSFIILIVGRVFYMAIDSTPQHLTYEGQAKIVDVSPIKKGGVQDVTFQYDEQVYQTTQPTKVTQNINKGDKVQLKCYIKHGLKSDPKYNNYQNKDGSFKKKIKLQDHMDELKLKAVN